MPMLHVPKSPHLHRLAISPRPSVGIVLHSAYDMHVRPYIDHRTMTGTTPVSLGPVMQ